MKRALALALLLAACHRKTVVDAGAPVVEEAPDAGPAVVRLEAIDARVVPDAGVDAGVFVLAAAVADAGAPAPVEEAAVHDAAVEPANDVEWVVYDGGPGGPGGVTDYLTLRKGVTTTVSFQVNVGVRCDDLDIIDVKMNEASYDITGKSPGVTHCMFKTALARYFEITVKP